MGLKMGKCYWVDVIAILVHFRRHVLETLPPLDASPLIINDHSLRSQSLLGIFCATVFAFKALVQKYSTKGKFHLVSLTNHNMRTSTKMSTCKLSMGGNLHQNFIFVATHFYILKVPWLMKITSPEKEKVICDFSGLFFPHDRGQQEICWPRNVYIVPCQAHPALVKRVQ